MTTQHPRTPTPPTKLLLVGQQELNTLQTLADPSQVTTLTLSWCTQVSDLSPLALVGITAGPSSFRGH